MVKALVILFLVASIFGGAAFFSYRLFVQPQRALREEKAFGTPTPAPDATLPEFARCLQLKQDHKLAEARAALEKFLENYPGSTKLEEAKAALGELNVDIFLSATPSSDKQEYVIQRGDTLNKIEKQLQIPGELLLRSNNLEDPRRLSIGQVLYVSRPQFSIAIQRKLKRLTLYNHGKFFKQYTPQTWSAPVARTAAPITGKVTEVAAWKNGQRVAFGSREYIGSSHWVQFSVPGFTLFTDPAEGGEKAGAGLALSAADMDELSALLTRGVPVTIE